MQVIITSMPEKLPEEVRAMIDESRPLAAGIGFFEERFTTGGSVRNLALGVVLGLLGMLFAAFGVYLILHSGTGQRGLDTYDFMPLVAGLVLILGAYLLISSLGGRRALIRDQEAGRRTRYGIFLGGDLLVSRSWFDTTVIPRPLFKGLARRAVQYELDGQVKSFALPSLFVGIDPAQVEAAILGWKGRA